MAITRTIGKNTLGDNNKMKVRLREYDMSSQNLSYVFRSTMGVGMLVPFMKIICQKGDIFDIKLTNKTMTHPTLGPLFGSFKLQHFIFTAGFRLYNSWLHNNRTGIGMKMSDIKLPMISNPFSGTSTSQKNNPSSLYSYIGWKGAKKDSTSTIALKQGVPLLIYLDIFKNYFANTQEDNFYIITGDTEATVTFSQTSENTFTAKVGQNANYAWIDYLTNFNRTYGNFATGESEDFMVLNRNYEDDGSNGISNGSTYINPQEHIDIFADTALDSQNFWVQTACEITRRGNYSAKQIPNF